MITPRVVLAQSSYVLPYPSAMPGSVWYKLDLVKEKLMQFWYFGDFSQFDYNLKLADKYLVESKVLFNYKQYLLGYKALLKSDKYFNKIESNLNLAKIHGKNISNNRSILKSAAEKHIEELIKIKTEIPENFNWSPEKSRPTYLKLWETIENSVKIRRKVL